MRSLIGAALLLVALNSGAQENQATGSSETEVKVVAIGETAPELRFKDIRYLPRTLDEVGSGEAYVLAFFTNSCPVAQRYMGKLVELEEEYDARGVRFIGVNIGPDDSIRDVAWHALQYDVFFPVVKDTTGVVTRTLGITRTPEVAVLDKQKKLRYRGRIDDQYRLGGVRPEVGRHDLREALDALLAGEKVEVSETTPEGCAVTFPSTPAPEQPVTFHKDIAPIINNHCLSCHRPDGNAPFSLNSYNKVSARADMIAEVVDEGRMPPWYAHPEFGEFMDDRSLSHDQKMLVKQWLMSGKPEGDAADAPPAPEFPSADGWQIEPDLVITATSPVAIPKTGFVPYVYQFLPHTFENDTYIEAIEIKPTNPKVLHHANLVFTQGGYRVDQDTDFLTGTVPGGVPSVTTEGIAWFIPKGAKLVLQEHLVTTGQLESNTMSVGLRFARGVVNKRLYYHNLDAHRFKIPPFARAHRLDAKATLEEDVTGVGLFSHMHLRGRDMTFYAHLPNGETEVLMSLPNYSFDWQITYRYPPGKFGLPAGTVVEAIAHYDNSPWNPYNPAPEKEVKNGAQTVDEMFNGFYVYTKNSENLNIRIDPQTGAPLTEVASSE